MDGDHRPLAETLAYATFDIDGQRMRPGDGHPAVDTNVHLDKPGADSLYTLCFNLVDFNPEFDYFLPSTLLG